MSEELENCPFCGSDKAQSRKLGIKCGTCGAWGPDEDKVIDWNTRTPPPDEQEALNAFCNELLGLGFSTGHGDSWRDLAVECLANLKAMREKYEGCVTAEDARFLLSFAPKDCPEGLDPTLYHTLTYEGDKKLQDRIDSLRAMLSAQGEKG